MPGSSDSSHPKALINAPSDEVGSKLVQIIREIKPHVLITFDPYGGYGHPDHIFIHQAVHNAFKKASDPSYRGNGEEPHQVQKFYYYTISKTIMKWMVWIMPLIGMDPTKYGQNGDINLREISKAVYPIHAKINYSSVKEIRSEASFCYVSQGGKDQNKGAAGLLRGWSLSTEVFTREYPAPVTGYVEKDLFEGVIG